MNLIEKAEKIICFSLQIINACNKQGVTAPSDEQIGDYINQGYGMDVNDFMADWTEHKGMFRIVDAYSPLEQKTLDATLKLSDDLLRELWNQFIEEAAIYGEDSYIYDLADVEDSKFLGEHMDNEELLSVCLIATKNNGRYIQWLANNDNSIKVVKDMKSIIKAYWGEIFERIMLYPSCYGFDVQIYAEGDGSTYFDDVFFPVIAEEVGYKIDGGKGTITKIEK
jgi:hypothetical protein